MRAVGGDANGGQAAEVSLGRAQNETAAEFEQPELATRGIANVEAGDRLGLNLDCMGRRGGWRCLRRRGHGADQPSERD
jgi:hypothetical protein